MPGVMFVVAFVMIAELATGFSTSDSLRAWLAISGCIAGIISMVVFLAWEQNRWYWVLTGNKLVGGRGGRARVYSLESITKVVPGLPGMTKKLSVLADFAVPGTGKAFDTYKNEALMLKFKDGTLIPFHLHNCVNGSLLMAELTARVADRVDTNYVFTENEKRCLLKADWNRQTRARG